MVRYPFGIGFASVKSIASYLKGAGMASMDEDQKRKTEERRKALIEQYGEEKAEQMLRMEKTDTASKAFHQPPDQGNRGADAWRAMQDPSRRSSGETPAPMSPDGDRHAAEDQDIAGDAREKGRKRRDEPE